MTTANRTGDDEGRIVHGGELPEGDNSLDDVVVDKPSQKHPDELWTSYLIRRLGYEGIEVCNFKREPSEGFVGINFSIHLNSGISLYITREINLDDLYSAAGSKPAFSQLDANIAFSSEAINLRFSVGSWLRFDLDYSSNVTQADFIHSTPSFNQRPLVRNYEHGKVYPAEQVITDLVNYIKETGIKK